MRTLYSVLVRWGPEWDGQSIYYTDSEPLFEQIKQADQNQATTFDLFSQKLKAQLRAVREEFVKQHPGVLLDDEEEMTISEAMEWLEVVSPVFPVIVAGETELTCGWNW